MPATPSLALFLSSMAKLQIKEEASLEESGEVGKRIRELRSLMVSMSARVSLR